MNKQISSQINMAYEDLLYSVVTIILGLFGCHKYWGESNGLGVVVAVMLTLLGVLWLAARIYHVTHKDEVFGNNDP